MTKYLLEKETLAHLDKLPQDVMDYYILEEDAVRLCVLHGTKMVNELRVNHDLGVLETTALGQATMGVALAASTLKGEDSLNFSMTCDGALGGFVVQANAKGEVRGYLKKEAFIEGAIPENLDISPYIGNGNLTVTRYSNDNIQPFVSTIPLEYSSIAKDLSNFYVMSEQIPTALSLSVFFDKTGFVLGAGSLFVQAMPGADETILEDLGDWLYEIPSLSKLFAEARTPSDIVHEHFRAFKPSFQGSRKLEFYCPCNSERFLTYLKNLESVDRKALFDYDPNEITIKCHNCGTRYHYRHAEID